MSQVAICGSLNLVASIIANYCSLSLFSLGLLDKLQGKVMTPTEKLEWWIILMVDWCHSFLL